MNVYEHGTVVWLAECENIYTLGAQSSNVLKMNLFDYHVCCFLWHIQMGCY